MASTSRLGLVLLLALGLHAFAPPRSHACGGFFCQAVPVVQTGEQIVYAVESDGSLTMSVRINYQGEAPEFAWILPVPETPVLSLGTTLLFDGLDFATRPSFQSTYEIEGTCRTPPRCEFPPAPDAGWLRSADASAPSVLDAGGGPVIFAEGALGPYETVVIGGASATEIHEWLTANRYDLPASSIPLLDAYVTMGQRFVALRLRNDASVSEIQPITLGFTSTAPCLPIRLTAIATQPDLPITAFFLASTRATPRNYSLIETPYPASLFLGTVTYSQWVSNEADDLGGQAFIADYAGATPALGSFELASIERLATSATPEEFLRGLLEAGYTGDAQLQAILTRFIVPPMGADPRSYFNCLARSFGSSCGEPAAFDPAGLAAAIDVAITQPRRQATAMLARHAYTTRLYTTMSAEEMTVDPEFVIDDGLEDVENVHVARVVAECFATVLEEDAAQRMELPTGESVRIREARRSPSDTEYCNARGGWLPGTHDAAVPPGIDGGPLPPGIDGGVASIGGGGGCATSRSRSTSASAVVSMLLCALAVWARRRSSPAPRGAGADR